MAALTQPQREFVRLAARVDDDEERDRLFVACGCAPQSAGARALRLRWRKLMKREDAQALAHRERLISEAKQRKQMDERDEELVEQVLSDQNLVRLMKNALLDAVEHERELLHGDAGGKITPRRLADVCACLAKLCRDGKAMGDGAEDVDAGEVHDIVKRLGFQIPAEKPATVGPGAEEGRA